MRKRIIYVLLLFVAASCGTKKVEINSSEIRFDKKWGDCGDGNPCIEMQITYDSLYSNDVDVTPVNSFIRSKILEFPFAAKSLSDLNAAIDSAVYEYESFAKDFPETKMPWTFIKKFKVANYIYPVISLDYEDYDYMGGAHGSFAKVAVNYKFEKGEPVLLSDPFDAAEKRAIIEQIKIRLRKKFKLRKNQPFADAGLWQEFGQEYKFNNNFFIEQKGIRVIFNQYEIAPYAMGVIDAFIPYKDLPPSIKKKLFN